MPTHAGKNPEHQNRVVPDRTTAAKAGDLKQNSASQFVDNRPEAIQLQKLPEMADSYSKTNSSQFVDNRPEVAQMKKLPGDV